MKENTMESFLKKVDEIPVNANGCKIWNMGKGSTGYGHYSLYNRTYSVPRLLYMHHYPGNYKGLVIRHKCDIRACCNIEHLESGTQKDNIHDIIKRNRSLFGDDHRGNCKLTEDQVLEIRRRYERGNGNVLAKEYNISQFTVYSIVKRINWKHI